MNRSRQNRDEWHAPPSTVKRLRQMPNATNALCQRELDRIKTYHKTGRQNQRYYELLRRRGIDIFDFEMDFDDRYQYGNESFCFSHVLDAASRYCPNLERLKIIAQNRCIGDTVPGGLSFPRLRKFYCDLNWSLHMWEQLFDNTVQLEEVSFVLRDVDRDAVSNFGHFINYLKNNCLNLQNLDIQAMGYNDINTILNFLDLSDTIRSLTFVNSPIGGGLVTEGGLVSLLSKLPLLTHLQLTIDFNAITDNTLTVISGLDQLKSLELISNSLIAEAGDWLSRSNDVLMMTQLRQLKIADANIGDSLVHLAPLMPNLEHLNLFDAVISSSSLISVARNNKELKCLYLNADLVLGASLANCVSNNLKKLNSLAVRDDNFVVYASDKLKRNLSGIEAETILVYSLTCRPLLCVRGEFPRLVSPRSPQRLF